MNYPTAIGLILEYIGLGLEKCSDYLTGVRFWIKKTFGLPTGLWLILFYVGLELIKRINQVDMPLEQHVDFLELSVKQFVIQPNPFSLGQIMRDV